MDGVRMLTPTLGQSAACTALGIWRGQPRRDQARCQRRAFVGPPRARMLRASPPLALEPVERQALRDTGTCQ